MAHTTLPVQGGSRNIGVVEKNNQNSVGYVVETFKVNDTVNQLYTMMKEATSKDYSPNSINAACNCVARLNETINTVINAARFVAQDK